MGVIFTGPAAVGKTCGSAARDSGAIAIRRQIRIDGSFILNLDLASHSPDVTTNHVETAALGCPAKRSVADGSLKRSHPILFSAASHGLLFFDNVPRIVAQLSHAVRKHPPASRHTPLEDLAAIRKNGRTAGTR